MATSASKLAIRFIAHLNNLDITRKKAESLFSEGKLVRRDIEQVYKGLFFDAYASFESFLEDLFLGLLVNHLKLKSNKRILKIKLSSYSTALNIIRFKGKYINWLPYNNTEDNAKIFFYQGKPFTNLSTTDKTYLTEIITIRNALAHNSSYSKKQFEKKVLCALPLLSKEKTPIGFLRSVYRSQPTETRYMLYINALAGIAKELTS